MFNDAVTDALSYAWFMSFGQALNVEIGVEYQNILLLCFFNVAVKCILRHFHDIEKVG